MTINEIAVRVVKDYLRYVVPKPKWWFSDDQLYSIGVQRWAVEEIIVELRSHPNIPPLDTLENLRRKWDNLACAKKGSVGLSFSIAYDTVTHVIDYLIK